MMRHIEQNILLILSEIEDWRRIIEAEMPKENIEVPVQLQFTEKPVLIAAIGSSLGKFFMMRGKQMAKVAEVKEEIPEYSDREGFFERRGKGNVYGSGSVYEINDDEYKNRFAKKTAAEIKKILTGEKVFRVYILEPEYMKGMIARRLPKNLRTKIVSMKGNYVRKAPLEILKKIIASKL